MHEIVTKLWAAGLSVRQIAEDVGEGTTPSEVLAIVSGGQVNGISHPEAAPQVTPEPVLDAPPEPTYRYTLLDLQGGNCRWPEGDVGDPDFHFCGVSTLAHSSYCAYHHGIACIKIE